MDLLVDGDEVGEAIRQKEKRRMHDKTMVSNCEIPDLKLRGEYYKQETSLSIFCHKICQIFT